MKLQKRNWLAMLFAFSFLTLFAGLSCQENDPIKELELEEIEDPEPILRGGAVFLVIDDESIDDDDEPNRFRDSDINDDLAEVGLRAPLPYFVNNVGRAIWLYTGEVGDEGWFAPKTIPSSWRNAGPTDNGTLNFFAGMNGSENLLDEIPNVSPLRATGLAMLKGATVYAVVYDSDISINYSPLEGNLKGATLGVVAFTVLDVVERTDRDRSSSSLPKVAVRINSVSEVSQLPLSLFSNAPVPRSSSEPKDIVPPASYDDPIFVPAP